MNSVRVWREKNGWTQEHLSELTGLSVRTIHRVEKGERVGLETWSALAAIFETTISSLQQPPLKPEEQNMEKHLIEPELQSALVKVRQIRNFYMQLLIFAMINLLLLGINIIMTPEYWWAFWVIGGWGIGILIKAFRIWLMPMWFDDEWERKAVEKQLNKKL